MSRLAGEPEAAKAAAGAAAAAAARPPALDTLEVLRGISVESEAGAGAGGSSFGVHTAALSPASATGDFYDGDHASTPAPGRSEWGPFVETSESGRFSRVRRPGLWGPAGARWEKAHGSLCAQGGACMCGLTPCPAGRRCAAPARPALAFYCSLDSSYGGGEGWVGAASPQAWSTCFSHEGSGLTKTPCVCARPASCVAQWGVQVGAGSHKVIYKAWDNSDGKLVAWNVVPIVNLSAPEQERLKAEVKILSQLQHPRLIHFYASWTSDTEVVFITAIVGSGDLRRCVCMHTVRGVRTRTRVRVARATNRTRPTCAAILFLACTRVNSNKTPVCTRSLITQGDVLAPVGSRLACG
jgi:hypothetical protein